MRNRFTAFTVGQRIGKFTIAGRGTRHTTRSAPWPVICVCGYRRTATTRQLRQKTLICRYCDVVRRELSPVDAAWLAAAVDGEGAICIGVSFRAESGSLRLHPTVVVSNTVRAYVIRAARAAGCGIRTYALPMLPSSYSKGRGEYFSWEATSWPDVEHILRAIRPHLVIKGGKARGILACCTFRRKLLKPGQPRLTRADNVKFVRYVRDCYLRRFQYDGKAIKKCTEFLVYARRKKSRR